MSFYAVWHEHAFPPYGQNYPHEDECGNEWSDVSGRYDAIEDYEGKIFVWMAETQTKVGFCKSREEAVMVAKKLSIRWREKMAQTIKDLEDRLNDTVEGTAELDARIQAWQLGLTFGALLTTPVLVGGLTGCTDELGANWTDSTGAQHTFTKDAAYTRSIFAATKLIPDTVHWYMEQNGGYMHSGEEIYKVRLVNAVSKEFTSTSASLPVAIVAASLKTQLVITSNTKVK